MSGNQIYQHPDGFTLAFNDNVLTATDDEGKTVCLPIGEVGITELGERMVSIGQTLISEQEEKFTSERAGAVMGLDLINELLAVQGKPQAEAFRALHDKLYALSMLEHLDSAAGGFAGAVVNVLKIGIANIPKFEREDS